MYYNTTGWLVSNITTNVQVVALGPSRARDKTSKCSRVHSMQAFLKESLRETEVSIILRITNRCHFFVIFLYYMSLPYMSHYIERPRRTRTYAKHHMNQVATSSNSCEYP